MRIRKPSPAMIVAVAAVVLAMTGTAVAAVNFARNAGAVDHKSAVWASSSKAGAAGKLVTTRAKGADRGKFSNRFLAHVPYTSSFARATAVIDNNSGAAQTLSKTRLGTLTLACNDQRAASGVEDPSAVITFSNTSPNTVNYARSTGTGNVQVIPVASGAAASFTINASNTFEVHAQAGAAQVLYRGHERQDGQGTASAQCVTVGVGETFAP
jgi:hypothetical protein